MLSEFTFISITFNHSKYILDHLESIKKVIDLYAKDTAVDLIISDDYSTDDTLAIANDWINNNRYLFRDVTILQVQQNTQSNCPLHMDQQGIQLPPHPQILLIHP